MAAIDEIVFHQVLAWHHVYDRSTTGVGLLSDGLLHAAELAIVVGGFCLYADLRHRDALAPAWARAGFFLGAGAFQIFDGIVDHNLLRPHRVRFGVDLLPYDLAWNAAGLALLLIGLILAVRDRRGYGGGSSARRTHIASAPSPGDGVSSPAQGPHQHRPTEGAPSMTNERIPVAVNLPECLLLLATENESGRIDTKSGALDLGLAGAALTELLLLGRLVTADGKVTVADPSPTGDPILDDALATIAGSEPRDPKHWVTTLPKSHLRDRVLQCLVDKGILRREEHRILWVIPTDRYPAEDDAAERDIRDAVRAAVIDGAGSTPRTAALIGILKACDLTGTVLSKDERKRHSERIEHIADAEVLGGAVGKAVKELQDAMTTAAVTAAVAGAVAASS